MGRMLADEQLFPDVVLFLCSERADGTREALLYCLHARDKRRRHRALTHQKDP